MDEQCDIDYHLGAVLPTGTMLDVIDGGFVMEVRCDACGRTGEAVVDIEADVNWRTE